MLEKLKRVFSSQPEPLAGAKKLSLIAVTDYPRSLYTAYWEIGTPRMPDGRYRWLARILSYNDIITPGADDAYLLNAAQGDCSTEDEARRQSQTWVKTEMEKHRRTNLELN